MTDVSSGYSSGLHSERQANVRFLRTRSRNSSARSAAYSWERAKDETGYSSIGENIDQYSRSRHNMYKRAAILCGLFYYFLLGVEETIMCSFYSLEAQERGLSSLQIGLAFTMMEISSFAFSFLVMFFIRPKLQRMCCITGIFITAFASVSVGFLQWVQNGPLFLALTMVIETFIGIGAAMSLATVIPIITSFSLHNSGKITSWAEALLNLGGLIGPPFGSILYHFYDFCLPYFVSGALLLLCGLSSLFFLPIKQAHVLSVPDSQPYLVSSSRNQQSSSDAVFAAVEVSGSSSSEPPFDPFAYIKFISRPTLLIVSMLGILVAAQMTFFDVCLSLFLDHVFGMNSLQIGLMFLAYALSNVAMVPIYGVAVDRGYAVHVMLGTALGLSITFAVLSLPHFYVQLERIWFMVICFIIAGGFSAGAMVPCYLLCEKLALINGSDNLMQTKMLVATWINNFYAIGALIGSLVLAGPVYEQRGFYETCLVLAVLIFAFLIIVSFVVYYLGLLVKIFYIEPEEEEEDCANDLTSSTDAINEPISASTISNQGLHYDTQGDLIKPIDDKTTENSIKLLNCLVVDSEDINSFSRIDS